MSSRAPMGRPDGWERWERPALLSVPYAALVLSVVIVAAAGALSWAENFALAGAAAGWMLFFFTLHPAWRERPPLMTVFLAGLIVIMAVMVVRAPWYGVFAWCGYIYIYYLPLGRWRVLAAAAVGVVAATSQDGGLPAHKPAALLTYTVLLLFNVLIASAFTWFASVSNEQNEHRKRLVTDLSEANRKLETTLAENAGLHEQLLTQAREAGVLDERQRMAREIHDTLAQGLTGIITQLQAAGQARAAADRERRMEAAIRLARDSLSEARRSVSALRPEPLEAARLGEALAEVAGQWSALQGVAARVTTTGDQRSLPPEVEVALLRTAQEALANVAKHAGATRVGLTLSFMDSEVALDVRDDGTGFDPAQPSASGDGTGFGLTGMRERIEGLSGTLEIESEPGAGTAISAFVPTGPDMPGDDAPPPDMPHGDMPQRDMPPRDMPPRDIPARDEPRRVSA
jgi:signal transduction histidine kinase